jgi:hypothetical protein
LGVKIKIHKTVVKPGVVYGSETWAMTDTDMKRLSRWERKILIRIYGLVVEQGICIVRTNQELRQLYIDLDIVADIKKIGMDWTYSKNRSRNVQLRKYLRVNWK